MLEILNSCVAKIEGVTCDEIVKLDIIKILKHVSSSIKNSFELCKHHLKQANPSANQIEEAHERIGKRKGDASADVARMLFSIQKIITV